MADIENAGGGDVYATAEPDEASELGFTCCVACTAAGILAVDLSTAMPLLYYLATPSSVALLRALACAALLPAALGVLFGALWCCAAANLCLHGDTTGERQKDAPPPVHAAMD